MMKSVVKKAIRTAQSELWFLKEAKDEFYYRYRKFSRKPHDKDFGVIALIKKGEPGCFIDVGANQGQSIESIRLFAPRARIESFEPNPGLAQKLTARYQADPLVNVHNVGLSDHPGLMELYVPSYKGFVYDGLASLDIESAKSWINADRVYFFKPDAIEIAKCRCTVETLDTLNLDPIFIKIDVQGTEYSVIEGGLETVRKHQPILMVEGFEEDPRLAGFLASENYDPYVFSDGKLVPGAHHAVNTFLITKARLEKSIIQP